MYPILYDLALSKNCSVAEVKEKGWVIQFKVRLQGVLHDQWYEMASKLNRVVLGTEPDDVSWKWTVSKAFSVKFVYEHPTKDDSGPSFKRIWKAKIPAKIKTFMWLVEQGAILTKDNMLRRNWHGDPSCYFCSLPETMDHLFFECPVAKVVWGIIAMCLAQDDRPISYRQFWQWIPKALSGGEKFHMFGLLAICWAIWKSRNKACFEKKIIKNPCEILLSAYANMRYWTGLYPEEAQEMIKDSVEVMMKTALKLLTKKEADQPQLALLGGRQRS
jgi:hypothetical protein